MAMDQMHAVVHADPDEGDHREDREEVELDAGERQDAGRPDQADGRGQQREQRQPPVAEREHDEQRDDRAANRQSADELRQKAPRQLAVDQRQPRQRLGAIHLVDNRLDA